MKTKFLILFVSFNMFAQVQEIILKTELIGEHRYFGGILAKLEKSETQFLFTYRNAMYSNFTDFNTFCFGLSDREQIYEAFKTSTDKILILPDGSTLYFYVKKQMGISYAEVIHESKFGIKGKLPYLSEKALIKLFNP
jgi:hypothetical protein